MKFGKKEIRIPFKYVILIAMLYLIIPICIFFIGWTKLYIGLPLAIFLFFALFRFYVSTYKESVDQISVPGMHLIFIALFFALWVWSTGIGNFFVSAYDHPWRTAMFRDLINYDWPVIYPETGNAFVYYLCYWMVPALFGKLFGWVAGNAVLLLWTYIGVLIVFFILLHICSASNSKTMWTVALMLFSWSGLNIIASIVAQILNLNLYEFELGNFISWCDKMYNGYSFNFYYRTNQDALMEIYNQATPLWIATLIALDNRKRIGNYAFIGMCLIPFAPIPFMGLFILFITFFIHEIIDKREFKRVFKSAFSMQNIIAILAIAPIFLLFYTCNSTTQGGEGGGLMLLPLELFDRQRIFMLVAFWLFQFGIVAALIYSEYRKKYLYYVVVIWLMLCPLIEFGKRGGRDFCMNASLPALFLLMSMTIKYINKNIVGKILTTRNAILICVLLLSSMSAIGGVALELDQIGNIGKFPIVDDRVYTLSDKEADKYENFLVSEWGQSVFYQYIAK
ncbi:MAG: hypothetical protein K2O59_16230 [Lachnospiraceae bacterium]|nr:hypothetical protein [Lachnospiraceae bacterium]